MIVVVWIAVAALTACILVAVAFWAVILYHEICWHFEKKKRGTR
jgi:hypothetical protein